MRIIVNETLDPYFNLASEEYFLETADDDVFMLWRNSPSVIIGKNQNPWAEIDREFVEKNSVKVVRRLTGGGAVFHDPGNVNFTFITKAPDDPKIDFAPFTEPVIDALRGLGIDAVLGGRNDIVAAGCKISGNAQCVYRRKDGTSMLMHHGTLLYDADVSALAGALTVNSEKLRSKGIKSVRSRVRNIREIGGLGMSASEFMEYVLAAAEKRFSVKAEALSPCDRDAIDLLSREKYSTWEWNYGRSPELEEMRSARFPWGSVSLGYTLDRGIIKICKVTGDFFGTEDATSLESALGGCRFDREHVRDALRGVALEKILSGADRSDIEALLFGEGNA